VHNRLFRAFYRYIQVILLLSLLALPGIGNAAPLKQEDTPQTRARALLEQLTPEEKVGQLFLVTFNGVDVGPKSVIYDLTVNNLIGGVILSSANDNFTDSENNTEDARQLIHQLQNNIWEASRQSDGTVIPANLLRNDSHTIPLFIAISQEGDGYPYDQILKGLTPMPSAMSLGATWNPDLAKQAGQVIGHELEQLGINLLLGPSLDVTQSTGQESSSDMGTRSFGGNPYWVSLMGSNYIEGVHQGSNGRMAVVAKYFPGRGASDRSPDKEVPTVRKTLAQLKETELLPFFSVTGNATTPEKSADGLLVSHVRYDFQGNIRETTRPVSFDSQALNTLLELPALQTWRANNGLLVSDNLGSQAIRQYYDPSQTNFDSRLVARDAFLAGNDLLYISNFKATNDADERTTILRTLNYFAQKYREDAAFAQRVNASVERILTVKYKLYDSFTPMIVHPINEMDTVGKAESISFEVARQAATLISPPASEIDNVLPKPPQSRERIVFITNSRKFKQCSRCTEESIIAADALQNAVVRLYGPTAGRQIYASQLSSFTFSDLQKLLDGGAESSQLEIDLLRADWIVFAMQDVSSDYPESNALARFLSERPDLFRNRRVIAFAFNAPYYLDATNISKLTAYYGLYSKNPASIEVAARILFQELPPIGASPVSIPGIGYNLAAAVTPDPTQIIPLSLDIPVLFEATKTATVTPEPTPVPTFRVGDTIPLKTGVIIDHNKRTVPDNTPVKFILSVAGEGSSTTQQIEAFTTNGIARAVFRIENDGLIEIRVTSSPALTSEIVTLDITQAASAAITVIAPTAAPTETPFGAPISTLTPTVLPEAMVGQNSRPTLPAGLLATILILGSGGLIYWFGQILEDSIWRFRWALCAIIGGFLAYNYLALGLPGASNWIKSGGAMVVMGISLLGVLIGWGAGYLWKVLRE